MLKKEVTKQSLDYLLHVVANMTKVRLTSKAKILTQTHVRPLFKVSERTTTSKPSQKELRKEWITNMRKPLSKA